ncbi:MAG: division/cell wall cluster transcriptional repressor MraZ [Pirellulaceae bacterium]|nr:division/cell wall cluster transcriptional repressor MraZ [Pirellulaceae bacterium]
MLLTGTYERSLDDKQRLALPKRFREVLGADGQTLFLTPGTDGSLSLYPGPAFARMADKLAAQSPTAHDVRAFGRLLYAQTQSVELDGQGRLRVPPELARLAELGRDVVLVGVGDHIELWDQSRWQAWLAGQQPRYDQLAERAFGSPAPAQPAAPPLDATATANTEEVARPAQPR